MLLDQAITIAFERGAGVTRTHALRGKLDDADSVDGYSNRMSTTFTTLGERLANRAFKNLPAKHRRAAERWQTMDSGARFDALGNIFINLIGAEWKREERTDPHTQPVVDRALPAQYKSWTRGPFMPNCLGMAQQLIGFARAAGAPHLMVTTLTRQDETHWRRNLTNLRILEEMLAGYPLTGKVAKAAIRYVRGNIREKSDLIALNADEKQAHHCLLINISGSEWALVDPYIGTFKTYIDETDTSAAVLCERMRDQPDGTAIVPGFFNQLDETVLTRRIGGLLQQLLVARSRVPQLAFDDIPSCRQLHPLADLASPDATPEEKELLNSFYDRDMQAVHELAKQCLASYGFLKLTYAKEGRQGTRVIRDYLDSSLNLTMAIYSQLLGFMTRPEAHSLMEIAHPAYSLGLATAHHVSVNSDATCDPVIFAFGPSQFFVYDYLRFGDGNNQSLGLGSFAITTALQQLATLPSNLIMPELALRLPPDWRHDEHSEHEGPAGRRLGTA